MPLFRYRVSDASGSLSELVMEGTSQADAARRIQRRGLMPLEFLGEGAETHQRGALFAPHVDIVEFTDRLVPLLEADIPLEKALGIIGDDHENPALQQLVNEMRRGLHEGRRLSDLIRERGRMFPPLYVGIVEAGEEAGALAQVMGELRRFLMESRELRSFIISSSIYPAFICATGVVMLVIVLGVIIPKFASALAGAGIKSTATDLLLSLSTFLTGYWWLVFPLVAAVVYLVTAVRREQSWVRRRFDALTLRLPVVRKLVMYSDIARLCRTMAILMRNGVHLLNTVSIASRVLQNKVIQQSITGLAGELRQGQKLSSALSESPYIPSLMLKMLAVGEETGAVETMLERVADRYETDLKALVKRLLSLFEPLVIVALGLGIGTIVTIMFLAIMDMQGKA